MKKFSIVFCIIGITYLLSGCINEDVQKYWTLATSSPEDTVTHIYAEKFAEEVNRLSNGTMHIYVYPNSVLGGDREIIESCMSGDIPFIVQSTAPQVSFMPELAVFDIPFAFTTIEEARISVDNEIFYQQLEDIHEEVGLKLLGYADQGFRVITSNREINSIEDFNGLRIRTMENTNHIYFWKLINTNPTPMAFSEVYIGLQQNTIDAQENPFEVIVSSRFYEQQNYAYKTNHLPHFISLVVNQEFMEDLTVEQQNIIIEAANNASKYAREQSDLRVQERIEIIEEAGTMVLHLPEEVRMQIREASHPVYISIEEQVGNQLFNAYLNNALY